MKQTHELVNIGQVVSCMVSTEYKRKFMDNYLGKNGLFISFLFFFHKKILSLWTWTNRVHCSFPAKTETVKRQQDKEAKFDTSGRKDVTVQIVNRLQFFF